jgi:AcrR family transcriptional regulator
VDAAFEAFCERGYAITSTNELRAAAAVSGGAFSHHFPTKKELGLAVIRDRVRGAVERAWIEPLIHAPTALAGIGQAFTAIIEELEGKGAVSGCPLNNMVVELAGQDAELRGAMRAIFGSWVEALAARFGEDRAKGLLEDGEPEHLAALVVAAFSGAMAMAKAAQSASPLRACWSQLEALLGALYRGGRDERTG